MRGGSLDRVNSQAGCALVEQCKCKLVLDRHRCYHGNTAFAVAVLSAKAALETTTPQAAVITLLQFQKEENFTKQAINCQGGLWYFI